MKITEIRELNDKELQERVETEIIRLEQMTINHSISSLDNPALIKQQRRTIARMKTVLHQRELNQK
ncbi:MAG: 50S ribosomal protein L29 [Bacteroidales bacterium]|jgi:large subunit ribosomal protein L29|nr:50S ribosomal protein L29 [Bacteroidales bacterium]